MATSRTAREAYQTARDTKGKATKKSKKRQRGVVVVYRTSCGSEDRRHHAAEVGEDEIWAALLEAAEAAWSFSRPAEVSKNKGGEATQSDDTQEKTK